MELLINNFTIFVYALIIYGFVINPLLFAIYEVLSYISVKFRIKRQLELTSKEAFEEFMELQRNELIKYQIKEFIKKTKDK